MRANRRRDTLPELRVRRLLHSRGLRYRVDSGVAPLGPRSRADIVFTRLRLVVYIDGCFWHVCPIHATSPKANSGFWAEKLARNVERDRVAVAKLESAGWTVLRFWEHQEPQAIVARIASEVDRLRRGHQNDASPN